MNIPLLEEIDRMVSEVSDKDLARSERDLKPLGDGEEVLGPIHAIETRRLWALWSKTRGKYDALKHQAAFESDTKDEERELLSQAERWSDLAHAISMLFWIQAKDDIGDRAWFADVGGKQITIRMVPGKESLLEALPPVFTVVASDRKPTSPIESLFGRMPQ